jgi:TrpR-related protein YerC/YecD
MAAIAQRVALKLLASRYNGQACPVLKGGVMTVTKHASDADLLRLYWAFAQSEDPAEVEALMEDLCTIREIHEMAQRLTVAFMLNAGESYAAIQERTGASATTIARVSKCLNYGTGGYRAVIDRKEQPNEP